MPEYKRFKKKLLEMVEEGLFDNTIDSDHPNCPRCGEKMAFHGHDDLGDFPIGEGYWKCDNCGYSLTENELHGR